VNLVNVNCSKVSGCALGIEEVPGEVVVAWMCIVDG
jgi:hypothetical protein